MPDGPDFDTLRRLRDLLPSMAQGVKQNKLTGKGKKVPRLVPHQICKVCAKAFDRREVMGEEEIIAGAGLCEKCAPLMEECVALVSDNRYAFVKSAKLADMAGQIVPLTGEQMDRIAKEFQAEWQVKASDEAASNHN